MYLGLRFSNNLSWKAHINDIAIKARKKLNLMLPLKMKVDRKSLEIMYTSFVQPSMEYASVVWGGAYDCDILKLETIHIDAMRLVTGATARSNIANVTTEYNGVTVTSRIEKATTIILFKIITGRAPSYLTDILIDLNRPRNYMLRNNLDIKVPFCRLESYKRSFFPRSIRLWNDLDSPIICAESVESFKQQLKDEEQELQVLYYYGQRWPSVHHARMRMGCSKLNYDLHFNLHVVDRPNCACGAELETADHFLLYCPIFTGIRQTMLANIPGAIPINCQNLLFGNIIFDIATNVQMFMAVHQYIIESNRFS